MPINDSEPSPEQGETDGNRRTPQRAALQLLAAGAVFVGVGVFVRPYVPFVDELYTRIESVSLFGSDIDCGNLDAQKLAVKLVRDSNPLKNNDVSSGSPESQSRLKTALAICPVGFFKSVRDDLGIEAKFVTDDAGNPTCSKITHGPDLNFTEQGKAIEEANFRCGGLLQKQVRECEQSLITAANADFQKAAGEAVYTLDAVRTARKDDPTGKVTCAAKLNVAMPGDWGRFSRDISFTVEKTTKDEMYVSVFGLD